MFTSIGVVPLVVRDQQKAKEWYVEKLGFEVRMDEPFEGGDGSGTHR